MLFKRSKEPRRTIENEFQSVEMERQTVDYIDSSKRFYQVSRNFSKQYAHIYSARLNTFRNILAPIIHKKWSNTSKVLRLCELREKDTDCIIIGTLFKLQELKPSILKEISDQLEIIPQPTRTHFVHDSDSIVLEDELQRIKLVGDCINIHQVVTGVVCALLGSEDENGVFTVKDVCWAGCNIQKPLPNTQEDRYVVLMSGLNLAATEADHIFSINLLIEWISGLTGNSEYQEEITKIVRVIIAGGIFTSHTNESILKEADVISAAGLVDSFCAAVSAVTPLDVMPGSKDPSGIMIPQKPFHYCLFPKATEYKSFNRVSNPYECSIAGFPCLGSSGESFKDVIRYSNIDNILDVMKKTLEWRHMAPTCPDTVPSTPCVDTDPFIIYNCPAIYFCGNCEKFATDLFEGSEGQRVRLVCIPDFCTTKTVAIVNLSTLECYSMTFT